MEFQSTLPHGSDDSCFISWYNNIRFQSTLPHGSDQSRWSSTLRVPISIHAPSRERLNSNKTELKNILNFNPRSLTGATNCNQLSTTRFSISIHAPSRERRLCGLMFCVIVTFQSTLPHGSDNRFAFVLHRHFLISIPAPSRERPVPRGFSGSKVVYFNPRSLTGATKDYR